MSIPSSRRIAALLILTLIAVLPGYPVEATRPDAPRYGRPGPYRIGVTTLNIYDAGRDSRPLDAVIWYPAAADAEGEPIVYPVFENTGAAIRNAMPNRDGAPFPLILFSHGFGGFRTQSTFLTEHLASYGFVVMAVNHPGTTADDIALLSANSVFLNLSERNRDVIRQIDAAEALSAGRITGGALRVLQGLKGRIDTSRVVVTGHSFGGYTAILAGGGRLNFPALERWCASGPESRLQPGNVCVMQMGAQIVAERIGGRQDELMPSIDDPRVAAVVALAPWNAPIFGAEGLAAVTLPALILVGTEDRITVPERDAYAFYEQLGSERKALVSFENAGHMLFVDKCPARQDLPAAVYRSCADAVWDADRAHDLINHFSTAFILATLRADSDAAQALRTSRFVGVTYRESK